MKAPSGAHSARPVRRRAADVRRVLARLVAVGLLAIAIVPVTRAADGVAAKAGPLTEAQQRQILEQIESVGRRGFLYEVTRAEGDAPGAKKLFLYGTIHLGRVGSEPFNAPVLQALRRSRRLALEADPTDAANVQALAAELGQYRDGDGLERHVPPDLMARVRAFGERNGMPDDRVARFRPWLLANMISLTQMSSVGLDPMLGSELYLSGFARGLQLPIVEVEGLETQLRLLSGLPEAMQTAELDEALSEVGSDASLRETRALFDLWLNGDEPAGDALVADLHREAQSKVFERYFVDQLIDRRNHTMADQAEHYLERPGNTFFAIGSLHLFGDAGLIREFERRGYRVVDLQPPLHAGR